ncbi:hypothetical protein HMPREF3172_04580 [Brevibacterium sp. HMSC08F02]|uniref:5-formyltetrahydrofolate cyclo-ligase n=1 Tax=Brevibacterium sp. HMSC08F02 TaxID=1581140 RepID=UPI0008A53C2B|nr:5-formyltetrahydrofolate cyclo-ligase [Brevibacterium sp. HMSC08F02]OFT26254.1 hypothetical protein HMPREF3172_04580 [Brevibacterium sp. HMSC08F02]
MSSPADEPNDTTKHSDKTALRAEVRKIRRSRAHEAEVTGTAQVTGAAGSAGTARERLTRAQEQLANTASELIADRPAVVAYAALPGEPNLDPALNAYMSRGGTVFLPVTHPNEPLSWGRAPGTMDLPPQGKWRIREPREELTTEQLAEHLVTLARTASRNRAGDPGGTSGVLPQGRPRAPLVLVPGLRFGADGTRLGNGGGFYDRTFGPRGAAPALAHEVPLTGVCFSWEFGGHLGAEDWDLAVGSVLTENGLRAAE